jgi:hypothetical protein
MSFIYAIEHEPDMIDFMRDRIDLDLTGQPLDGPNWFCVTVREQTGGNVVAALACEFKTWFDVSFSAAIDDPDAITRRLLRGIFQALFSKARRVTALVEPSNHAAQSIVVRLGFVYEGFVRRGLDGEQDALLYGMLQEDCRYLGVRAARTINGGDPDGLSAQGAGSIRHGVSPAGRERRVGSGQRYH